MDALRPILAAEPRIAYALLFGSAARGSARADSDLDVAVGVVPDARFDHHDLGALVTRL